MTTPDAPVHYDCTRIALIDALGNLPLGEHLHLEPRGRMADALLAQMPVASEPASDQARMDYEVTLATLRNIVERTLAMPAGTDSSRGYRRAMQDVKAVLDKHGAPADEPVHFGEQP